MKLHSAEIETLSSNSEFKQKFGIKQSDMKVIISLLRNKLYSNKIGTICREISSNSRDANAENGLKDKPIEIQISKGDKLMSSSGLSISFKDNGFGISPDRMADIFLNYGASTKRDSDEFIGGFGIGSKSPFSYTDSFNVVTIVDGIKYFYNLYIDESEIGECILLQSIETEESNGTQVIIPILNNDLLTFEKEVYYSTIYWGVQPTYIGFTTTVPKIEKVYEDENCLVTVNKNNDAQFKVLNEGIQYPVDTNKLIEPTGYSNYTVFAKFKTGELTLAATRENLEYTLKTSQIIKERFSLIDTTLNKVFEDYLSISIANQFEYFIKLNKVLTTYNADLNNIESLFRSIYKRNKNSINSPIELIFHNFVQFNPLNLNPNQTDQFSQLHLFAIDLPLPQKIYYADCNLTDNKKRTLVINNEKIIIIRPNIIRKLGPNKSRTQAQADILYDTAIAKREKEKLFLEGLGYKLIPLSEVVGTRELNPAPKIAKPKVVQVFKKIPAILLNPKGILIKDELLLDKATLDFQEANLIFYQTNTTLSNALENQEIFDLLGLSFLCNLKLCLITEAQCKHVKDTTKIIKNIDELIKLIPRQDLDNAANMIYCKFEVGNNSTIQYLPMIQCCSTLIKEASKIDQVSFMVSSYNYKLQSLKKKLTPSKVFLDAFLETQQIKKKYPLAYNLGRTGKEELVKEVTEYIEFIDNK